MEIGIIIIIIVTFITRTNSQNVSWAIQRRVIETVDNDISIAAPIKKKLQQIVKCLPKQVRLQSSLESIKRGGKSKCRRQSVPHSRNCHSKRAPSQFISYAACLQQWRTEPGAQSSCRFIIRQQGAQVSRQQTNPSLITWRVYMQTDINKIATEGFSTVCGPTGCTRWFISIRNVH